MKKILLALPTYSGHIPVELMFNLMSLKLPQGYSLNFAYVKQISIDRARSGIVQGVLQSDYDYLFFVDDDTIPPATVLEEMLALDKPIVGVPVPARKSGLDGEVGEGRLNLFENDWNSELKELKEPRKVGGCGMSCTLIKREVLEAVVKEYGKPFKFEEIDGTPWSEDTNFCRKAGLLGFETWAMNLSTNPQHMGQPILYVYEKENGINTYVMSS